MSACSVCGAQIEEGSVCGCLKEEIPVNTDPQQPLSPYGQQPPGMNPQPPQTPNEPPPDMYPQQPPAPYGQQPPPGTYQPPPQTPNAPPPGVYPQQPPVPYGQPPSPGMYTHHPQPPYNMPPPGPYGQQYPNQYPYPRQNTPVAPGKTIIRVAGIIMMVFSLIGIIVTVGSITTLSAAGVLSSLRAILYFEVTGATLLLIFGIIGTAIASKRERGGVVIAFGVILIIFRIIDIIWAAIVLGTAMQTSVIIGAIAGFVLPLMYIGGGSMNKKSKY